MSDFIVIFGPDNARIQHGVNAKDWQGVPNVAVNPDLKGVAGIPPHHWRLVDSKIVPAPESERKDTVAPTPTMHHRLSVHPAHHIAPFALGILGGIAGSSLFVAASALLHHLHH